MIYYVDIDNTICRTVGNDYRNSDPFPDKIAKINSLFEDGHEIVYWTSRGGTSGKDWSELTERQLRRWGCLYDELRLDKPSFDILFDDKAKKI